MQTGKELFVLFGLDGSSSLALGTWAGAVGFGGLSKERIVNGKGKVDQEEKGGKDDPILLIKSLLLEGGAHLGPFASEEERCHLDIKFARETIDALNVVLETIDDLVDKVHGGHPAHRGRLLALLFRFVLGSSLGLVLFQWLRFFALLGGFLFGALGGLFLFILDLDDGVENLFSNLGITSLNLSVADVLHKGETLARVKEPIRDNVFLFMDKLVALRH